MLFSRLSGFLSDLGTPTENGSAAPAADLYTVRVGGKVWRDQLREWLAFLGGLKGAKGLFRWREVQRAVALQLMDQDPGVQQAAIKSLKARSHHQGGLWSGPQSGFRSGL